LNNGCDIYVISLPGSPRRISFSRRATTALPWQYFDAHNNILEPLTYSPAEARRVNGRELQAAELGCFSSHYALWRTCAQQKKSIIVLEDDVYVDWNFLRKFLQDPIFSSDVQYLRLYSKFPTKFRVVCPFFDRFIIEFLGHPFGTQGYFLSPAAASSLVSRVTQIRRPIDLEMDRAWAHGLPNLSVYPHPILEIADGSQIGGREPQLQSLLMRLKRLPHRGVEKIWKEAYFLSRLFFTRQKSLSVSPNPPAYRALVQLSGFLTALGPPGPRV
jgi:glycosyl transferase family 25